MSTLGKKRRKMLQKKIDAEFTYRQYYDDDVEVREGKCGCGVYAVRQFLPGELVIEVTGQLFAKKAYEGSTYVMELDKKWYLEPAVPAAFLNHSCNPNAELVPLTKYSLGVIALCNIEAGTEVTFDYQWEAKKWVPRCRCGAPNCRGWVVGQDDVKKMQRLARNGKKKKAR